MLNTTEHSPAGPASDRGQVVVIFAFGFMAIIMMLALLFDGARGLVLRRELQGASDAAALAGANVVQGITPRGCSATAGPPPGAPQAAVVAAVKTSVAANLPDYNPDDVVVTCPDAWDNSAVGVRLSDEAPTFFGAIFGSGPLGVSTQSGAVNGQIVGSAYSVIQLDPANLSWPQGRRGCPSLLLSGGPTARFDSTVYINSACSAANGGALATNGNAASLSTGGGGIRIVGEYKATALTITPAPVEHQPVKPDPLAWLTEPPISSMPVRSNAKLVQNGGSVLLEPGVYNGGIQLKSSAKAYLRPGIYVINGGGLDLGSQSELYAISASKSSSSAATWAADCPASTCGILIYNTGTASGSNAMGSVTVGAGAVLKVRAYNPAADTSGFRDDTYRSLLIWQSALPVPTGSYAQPILSLTGGGGVSIAGTVYAPSAKVQMGGAAGGSGGDTIDLTLQFIAWDLELYGNSSFTFRYNETEFARPLDYGLIQ